MNTDPDHTEPLLAMRTKLRDPLLRLHGLLLGDEPLTAALGHRSTASLRQA